MPVCAWNGPLVFQVNPVGYIPSFRTQNTQQSLSDGKREAFSVRGTQACWFTVGGFLQMKNSPLFCSVDLCFRGEREIPDKELRELRRNARKDENWGEPYPSWGVDWEGGRTVTRNVTQRHLNDTWGSDLAGTGGGVSSCLVLILSSHLIERTSLICQ